MKKVKKIQTNNKFINEYWGTKKDEVFTVKKIYFRNGEHHVVAFNESRTINLPYIFFNDLA
jgi:hypothetical protein|tara:strand:- start:417 stop:599 length:183 start_codon:yes stop_codon:yes gene_type:complete